MNRFFIIFGIVILICVSLFFSSVVHYKEYEPYTYMNIKNIDGDDQLIRINKIKSSVDIFYPTDKGLTNFSWITLNKESD